MLKPSAWVGLLLLVTMLACSSASPSQRTTPVPPVHETPQPAMTQVTGERSPESSPSESSAVLESQPTATAKPAPSPTPSLAPELTATPTPTSMPALELYPEVPPPDSPVSAPPFTPPPGPPSSRTITLTIPSGPYANPIYDRDDWKHWSDPDGDCQDVRQEVLIEESLVPVTFKSDRECQVASGRWFAAFTGATVDEPGDLDVDHLVPLANAHSSGGAHWPPERKEEYANYLADAGYLIAVTSSANRSKGARGPHEWWPPDETYWCTYAIDWAEIKEAWGLWMSEHEAEAVQEMLGTCADSPWVEVVRKQSSTGPGPTPTRTPVRVTWAAPCTSPVTPLRLPGRSGSLAAREIGRDFPGDGAQRPGRGWRRCGVREVGLAPCLVGLPAALAVPPTLWRPLNNDRGVHPFPHIRLGIVFGGPPCHHGSGKARGHLSDGPGDRLRFPEKGILCASRYSGCPGVVSSGSAPADAWDDGFLVRVRRFGLVV